MTSAPAPDQGTPNPGQPDPPPRDETRGVARHAHSAHGDALLRELREGWAPLPTQTLFSMAMAGLRVRLMRSIVTMFSIVLAIAFLTYTGMSSYLSRNLALAMQRYEMASTVAPAEMEEAAGSLEHTDLFSDLTVDQQIVIAKAWGMSDVTRDEAEIVGMPGIINAAKTSLDRATQSLARIQADPKAMKQELDAARIEMETLGNKLSEAQARQKELGQNIALGRWIAAGGAPANPALASETEHALMVEQKSLGTVARDLNKATDEQLKQLESLAGMILVKNPKSSDLLKKSLAQERSKRDGVELGKLLRRAGINVDTAIKGSLMDTWLIVMAMLTCAVGIANAMLMSVTERFREIGTMKCLGAQDNLVVKLFLLESGFLGGIGAVFGVGLGMLVAFVAAVLQFGGFWHDGFATPLQTTTVVVTSLLGGILLSVVGAVYPAFAASRMRPVDALRVDE